MHEAVLVADFSRGSVRQVEPSVLIPVGSCKAAPPRRLITRDIIMICPPCHSHLPPPRWTATFNCKRVKRRDMAHPHVGHRLSSVR